jgi:hypothetical protein
MISEKKTNYVKTNLNYFLEFLELPQFFHMQIIKGQNVIIL